MIIESVFRPPRGGKEVVVPLTDEVGNSLLDYLRHGRPTAPYPEVFLITAGPVPAAAFAQCGIGTRGPALAPGTGQPAQNRLARFSSWLRYADAPAGAVAKNDC